jgi:hypothetical protein
MVQVTGRLTGRPGVLMGQGLFASTTGAFGILEGHLAGCTPRSDIALPGSHTWRRGSGGQAYIAAGSETARDDAQAVRHGADDHLAIGGLVVTVDDEHELQLWSVPMARSPMATTEAGSVAPTRRD